MTDVALSIKNLSKMYRVYPRQMDRVKELARPRRKYYSEFWALRDINLDVPRGEVLGVVGRNGAGKSTLLKLIAGTSEITEGTIEKHGSISAILELGSGFHPEFSCRDNVFVGGMVMGMSRAQVAAKYDWIVRFSELADYMDMAFKTLSSGMRARLTFAVAASIEPDILIIDEALAAGDSYFVGKCLERIKEICTSGTTVLFVSHNTALVERLCKRALWLEEGRIAHLGDASTACRGYLDMLRRQEEERLHRELSARSDEWGDIIATAAQPGALGDAKVERYGTGQIRLTGVETLDADGNVKHVFHTGDPMRVRVHYEATEPVLGPSVGIQFIRTDGVLAASIATGIALGADGQPAPIDLGVLEGRGYVDAELPRLSLGDGTFFLSVWIAPEACASSVSRAYDWRERCYEFRVMRPGAPYTSLLEPVVGWSHGKTEASVAGKSGAAGGPAES